MKMNVILIVVGSVLLAVGVFRSIAERKREVQNVVRFEKPSQKPFVYNIDMDSLNHAGDATKDESPEKFYLIPLDTLSRFKRVGHKFLPHYIIENPRQNLRNHMHDWFYNDVFKKKNYNK